MSISAEEKNRYLRETAIVLAREGFHTDRTHTGGLRVLLDGAPLCEVTENGGITYDLDVQRQNIARDKPLVGRITYANGDTQDFTDTEAFLKCLREELPYRPTTGFRYEVLSDDPTIRKAVDDIVFDLYGEENPRQQEDYELQPGPNMTLGGM